ncbi:hypothetical protein HanXRQr2_Chr12g0555321 [Helianthus annuus]|uniref:Uncharacterized protein n=1 Tax=Helianthus annuus TaxID=4232 RepID=A0A9K3HIR7_HELAN|nr:hypothetical protein HanXRQr2_Chr12g0555321 [Helianthus annuus]KAJ0494607.1 hypothetical protein HanIR_Chr12g0599391 [Helianthus annuus]KAJ0676003.1 hypothetical protein HanLR1_Chr12g0457681 [Helianthus annuus]KAJ0679251.1 hypothetical protein HanOQP8_Chr12g0457261 [Helianthus annuus]
MNQCYRFARYRKFPTRSTALFCSTRTPWLGFVSYRRNRDGTVVPLASISAQPPQRYRLQPRIRSQPPLFAAFFHHEPTPLQFCFLIRRGRCLISLFFFRLTFQRFRLWDGIRVC